MPVNARLVAHVLVLIVLITLADISLMIALLIKPFNEKTAWNTACWTASWFWTYMQRHWEEDLAAGECLELQGDELPQGESAVIISNHLSYSDYYLVQHLAVRSEMLGSCRYFVKKEIVWKIPLFGWAFWALGMILVSRNWTNDAASIEAAFTRVKENRHPVWIILYPEGTRRTPRKLLESQAFARKNGKTELQHLLFPRTKGFVSTIKGLRDSHVKYVYDLTFLYSSPSSDKHHVPSLADQLSCANMREAGYGFTIHVKRTPITDLPEDEEGLRKWCELAWEVKDRRLEAMVEARRGKTGVMRANGHDRR